jgi:catechol 2,3-dioxygenase-like lactoylglutathione lyase family enzyme
MINGAHVIIYSADAEKDRAFFRDVLSLGHVDVGGGWLIFAFPPSELAVHPASSGETHELYLMCDDVNAFIAQMQARGVECSAVESLGWGQRTQIRLPGGGQLGVYQPRHARPQARSPVAARPKRRTAKSKSSRKAPSRPAKRSPAKKKGRATRRRRS